MPSCVGPALGGPHRTASRGHFRQPTHAHDHRGTEPAVYRPIFVMSSREHRGNVNAGATVHARSLLSFDPLGLRDFRGRVDPRLPLLPFPDLDGKEGVNGSSPLEGSRERPANAGLSVSWTSRLRRSIPAGQPVVNLLAHPEPESRQFRDVLTSALSIATRRHVGAPPGPLVMTGQRSSRMGWTDVSSGCPARE